VKATASREHLSCPIAQQTRLYYIPFQLLSPRPSRRVPVPNLKISADDEKKKVRACALLLKKQQNTSLSLVMKVAVQYELMAFDGRIRQLAADLLLEESPAQVPEAPPLPPVAAGIGQDTVDEYTKMGKAKKVNEAIAQAAKHAGVEDGNLTPSKIRESMDAPDQIVKAAGSWKEVKKRYLSALTPCASSCSSASTRWAASTSRSSTRCGMTMKPSATPTTRTSRCQRRRSSS
jgi:hypothetical protein